MRNIKLQIEAEKEKIKTRRPKIAAARLPLAEIAEAEEPKTSPEKKKHKIEYVDSELGSS